MTRIPADFLVHHAGEVLTCAGPVPKRGRDLAEVAAIPGGAVAAREGRIVAVGAEAEVRAAIELVPGAAVLDAEGGLVTPGFVDAHTHPIFAGFREDEFNRLLQGETYQEIAAAGGGIGKTVEATRRASDEELLLLARARLDRMLDHGTTTAEAKTGYGLTEKDELRQLGVLERLARVHPLGLVPTLLAAHAVPPEYAGKADAYVELVASEIIPRAQGRARFCDVFCDPLAFTLRQARRVLEAGLAHGMRPRLHADEFASSGGAELAADLHAASADHLGGIADGAVERLATAGVTAVLLPGTLFFLGRRSYAPARRLIEAGVAVALGTDLNPGTSHTESMTAILQLACLMMRMTVEEAINAATVNAAHSLGLGQELGSLVPGRQADLCVFSVPNRFHLVYHYGVNHARQVVKGGRLVRGPRAAPPVL